MITRQVLIRVSAAILTIGFYRTRRLSRQPRIQSHFIWSAMRIEARNLDYYEILPCNYSNQSVVDCPLSKHICVDYSEQVFQRLPQRQGVSLCLRYATLSFLLAMHHEIQVLSHLAAARLRSSILSQSSWFLLQAFLARVFALPLLPPLGLPDTASFSSVSVLGDVPVVSGTFSSSNFDPVGPSCSSPPSFARSLSFSSPFSPPFPFSAAPFSGSWSSVGVAGGVSTRILNDISVPLCEDAGVMYVTKACVLFLRLIRLIARFEALLSESSSSPSPLSSRDLLELELRCDEADADELRSRSVLMIWPKIVSSWFLDFSRKEYSSSAERLGRACWIWFNGSVL